MPPELLSVKNILDRFKIGRTTLHRWRISRNFPKPLQLGDRSPRWRSSDIDAWAESQRIPA